MTRIPFDQLSKQFLQEFLTPLGTVERSLEVPGEPKFVDIWFQPSPQPNRSSVDLGLLGRVATTACALEPFRNLPTRNEVRTCILKLFWVHEALLRQAEREKRTLTEAELPLLWILASSASEALLNDFGAVAQADWLPGVYFLAVSLKTAIVSIRHLPRTEETLWLRILGKGETQQQAIAEVVALPTSDPRRARTLQMLTNWKVTMEVSETLDTEDRELFMALSQAYLEWEQATKRQGLQEGQRLVIENLLKVRFGDLDEQLVAIIPQLIELPAETYTPLLLQLSREDLLIRFQNKIA